MKWLAPEAAAERWPGMRFDGPVLFQPDAGRCRADDTVRALALGAGQAGAEVYYEQGVEDLSVDGDDAVVRTGFDEYRCPVAGGRGRRMDGPAARRHGAASPLEGDQGAGLSLPRPNDVTQWPSYIHHVTPYRYGLDTPGEGVKVAEHHGGRVVDPDERDFDIDPDGEAGVVRYVGEWFPGLDPMPVTAATCLYTTTPDERFVIERHGPLVVVSACSGHGFKFTPLIGRMAADLALG